MTKVKTLHGLYEKGVMHKTGETFTTADQRAVRLEELGHVVIVEILPTERAVTTDAQAESSPPAPVPQDRAMPSPPRGRGRPRRIP